MQELIKGGETYWGNFGDGIVDLAPYSAQVSEEVQSLITEREALLTSGSWDVFCGPLVDINGNSIVDEEQCLTDEEMLTMDIFVEGVVGELPNN